MLGLTKVLQLVAYRLHATSIFWKVSLPVVGSMQSTPVDCNHCAISQDLQCCAKGCLATNAFHVQ